MSDQPKKVDYPVYDTPRHTGNITKKLQFRQLQSKIKRYRKDPELTKIKEMQERTIRVVQQKQAVRARALHVKQAEEGNAPQWVKEKRRGRLQDQQEAYMEERAQHEKAKITWEGADDPYVPGRGDILYEKWIMGSEDVTEYNPYDYHDPISQGGPHPMYY